MGTGAIGGLTVKNESGVVVGTAGSVSTLDFNGSSGVTVTAASGAAGIATVAISAELISDSSPQLGGNLDLNGHDITGGITSTIEVSGSTNKIKFLYNALTDLPSASDWHGMFAHVHNEGAAYFAHAGQWIQLANYSDIPTDTNTTYSQDAVANASGVTLRLTDSTGNQDDIAITAGAVSYTHLTLPTT